MICYCPITVNPKGYEGIIPYINGGKDHRLVEETASTIRLIFTFMHGLEKAKDRTIQLTFNYRYRLLPSFSIHSPTLYFFSADKQYTGVSYESLRALLRVAHQVLTSASFWFCRGHGMEPTLWDPRGLLVLPGGICSKWDQIVSIDAQQKILNWFRKGGRIWAVCAGSYYCSTYSEFHINRDQKIKKIREIALFPGKCLGPLYTSLRVVRVQWERNQEVGYVAMLGGGCFIPFSKKDSSCQVLARFVDQPEETSIAVVKCHQGQGIAILSALHWEFVKEDFAHTHCISDWDRMFLEQSNSFRQNCMKEMLEELTY